MVGSTYVVKALGAHNDFAPHRRRQPSGAGAVLAGLLTQRLSGGRHYLTDHPSPLTS